MSSAKGSRRKSQKGSVKSRVQVISDFESEEESIGNYSEDGINQINQEILEKEAEALKRKRQENVYDISGLLDKDNKQKL